MALQQPDYFRSILAVTFTNKATEEMKSRIIETLTDLSKGAHSISGELQAELNFSEKQLQARATSVLKSILHNYSSFAVITIDAFFQKVVRSFAREVGVQGSFQVELNQQKVLSEVVDQLLSELGENQNLTNWLTEFAFYKINEGQSWDTRKDINGLANELFKELFVQEKDRIFQNMEDEDFMPSFMESLQKEVSGFEGKMESLGNASISIMGEYGLDQSDFSYGGSGVGGYLQKTADGAVAEPGKRVMQALEEGKWYTKTSDKKGEIDAAVGSGLDQVLSDIVALWNAGFTKYFTAKQIVRNIYTFGLLSEVSNQLKEYRDENDLLLISDFPIFLNNIIRDSDTPYIYEKIGSRYNNYLIDEFQDTSGLQWENFKPLVKDAIDAGKFSMVVGDIKQSIYRWRGGNWKLLLDKIKGDIGDAQSQVIPLNSNWRSKKNIIDFNNNLFEKSPRIIHDHFLREAGSHFQEIDNITKAYGEVFQNYVEGDKSNGGVIDVKFIRKAEDVNVKEVALERLIETIESLQDANFNLRDIAILIRNKYDGKLIADTLMLHETNAVPSKYKYDIISNESLFLKNSSVVNFIICALRTLSNFEEPVYQSELLYAWHVYLKNEIPQPIAYFLEREDNPLKPLQEQSDSLKVLNLVDQVESLIRLFGLNEEKDQVAYLLAFQDAVLDFSQKENSGADGFLQWWEDNSDRAIQVSDEMEAMRMMTIHKSKGLQFKVVIIPFCNWKMDHSHIHENIVWCDTSDQEPFNQLPYVPLKYMKDMGKSLFSADYWDERVKAYVDNLNLLYVAFTRAEEALYVMSEIDEKRTNGLAGVNDLLFNYFNAQEMDGWLAEEDHFHFGENLPYSVYEQKEGSTEFSLKNVISNPWQDREDLSIRSGQFIRNEEVLERINEGLIVHSILSKVVLRKDFEKALKSAEVEFGLGDEEMNQIKGKLRSIFSIEGVNDWFSDEWEVKSEMSIITETGHIKIPDRVMIKDKNAVVVDYKTGEENERNRRQVADYKTILGQMGYERVEGYLLYINLNKVEKVL
ncbi:MAG: ATP-dependent helicase/nuclease subunit A [Cyclobacteriaceae bacterium]